MADLARGWIPYFRAFFDAKRAHAAGAQANAELEHFLDETINNLEEDLHARIEARALPFLAKLREKDTSFLEDNEKSTHFFWFIASQYLRTPRMAGNVVEAASEVPGFNAQAAWGLMRTILATTLGHGFYVRRRTLRLSFLEAPHNAEFVTGDQPIINVKAVALPKGEQPDTLEIYYPLMPRLALLIGFDAPMTTTDERSLTALETAAYDEMIVNASVEQVYARTEAALVTARAQTR